jgi:hypothetical protein
MAFSWSCAVGLVLTATVATAAAPQVRTASPHLVLGQTPTLDVTVVPTRPDAVLRAMANAGTLEPQGPAAGPERRFTYRPPTERVPRVALLAFWEEDAAAPELAVHRLPLHGRMALKVATRPGAQVTVQVAGRAFGPVRATRSGDATVDVEVPPGATSAQVRARTARQEKATELPIAVPPSNPLLAVLTPSELEPGRPSHLWVVHAKALPGPLLEFTTRGVTLERVRFLRDRALFRVLPVKDGREPRIEVRIAGAPDAAVVVEPARR